MNFYGFFRFSFNDEILRSIELFSLFLAKVKVNGKSFDGTTSILDIRNRLRTIVGNASWFSEYQPVRFPGSELITLL